MVHFEKANLLSKDVLKNVLLMFLVAAILTRSFVNGAYLAAVEYLIHIVVLG